MGSKKISSNQIQLLRTIHTGFEKVCLKVQFWKKNTFKQTFSKSVWIVLSNYIQRCEKYCAIFRVNFGFNYTLFDRIFFITVAASIFMPRPPAELELQTNFNAIFKNVKILKIGPVEQKLWKIRQTVGVKITSLLGK